VAYQGGASGSTRPGAQALGTQQHTFAVILNVFLSRNLDQSMLKNASFWEKNCKSRLRVEGSAPEPPFASGGWEPRPQTSALLLPHTITTLLSLFLMLNAFYSAEKETSNYYKCSAFASSALLHLFFNSNSVSFVEGGARIFLAPGSRVP